MSTDLERNFQDYATFLEKIITKEVPLRDPNITVVKIAMDHAKEAFERHVLLLKRLKEKYGSWDYKILNIEKIFFDLLKKRRFIEKQQFAKTTERSTFPRKIREATMEDLMSIIAGEIHALKDAHPADGSPPFLVLMNMHATYPYIETKDVTAKIINEKGVYVIILYLIREKYSQEDEKPYKHGNYTVHSYPESGRL